jgi:hypothetical protein
MELNVVKNFGKPQMKVKLDILFVQAIFLNRMCIKILDRLRTHMYEYSTYIYDVPIKEDYPWTWTTADFHITCTVSL